MEGLKESSEKCPHGCYVGDGLYCEKCEVRTAILEEVEGMLKGRLHDWESSRRNNSYAEAKAETYESILEEIRQMKDQQS
jgi:hypothetical protein